MVHEGTMVTSVPVADSGWLLGLGKNDENGSVFWNIMDPALSGPDFVEYVGIILIILGSIKWSGDQVLRKGNIFTNPS